MLHLRLEPLI